MTLRSLTTPAALAFLAAFPVLLSAQMGETTASEDQRIEALIREQGEWNRPKSEVVVGFRMLNSGAHTRFGNLGTVPSDRTPAAASEGAVDRSYNNGYVQVDSARPDEVDGNGIQTSTPGGRYQTTATVSTPITDADGNVIGTEDKTIVNGDFLSYTPGLTRAWGYDTVEQTQVRPGYIALSTYSATSSGATAENKMGVSGGLEVSVLRRLSKRTARLQWSWLMGVSLNGINNKVSGSVLSTLHTNTDFYSLNGLDAPPLPTTTTTDATTGVVTTITGVYQGPTFDDFTTSEGTVITDGHETTTPISNTPSDSTSTEGVATVNGNWQIKGAYFMMKLGPSVRTQITERLGLSASVGLAGAYAGTRYSAKESIVVPNTDTTITYTPDVTYANRFLSGYYADFNLDWAANEVVALFGGLTAQRFGDYEQSLDGRTANIDLGSAVGIRGGITIKF